MRAITELLLEGKARTYDLGGFSSAMERGGDFRQSQTSVVSGNEGIANSHSLTNGKGRAMTYLTLPRLGKGPMQNPRVNT